MHSLAKNRILMFLALGAMTLFGIQMAFTASAQVAGQPVETSVNCAENGLGEITAVNPNTEPVQISLGAEGPVTLGQGEAHTFVNLHDNTFSIITATEAGQPYNEQFVTVDCQPDEELGGGDPEANEFGGGDPMGGTTAGFGGMAR